LNAILPEPEAKGQSGVGKEGNKNARGEFSYKFLEPKAKGYELLAKGEGGRSRGYRRAKNK
jgi:hypothetical protein